MIAQNNNNNQSASESVLDQQHYQYFKLCKHFQKILSQVFKQQQLCLQEQAQFDKGLKQINRQKLSVLQNATLIMDQIYLKLEEIKTLSSNNTFQIDVDSFNTQLIVQEKQKAFLRSPDQTFAEDTISKQLNQQTGSIKNSSLYESSIQSSNFNTSKSKSNQSFSGLEGNSFQNQIESISQINTTIKKSNISQESIQQQLYDTQFDILDQSKNQEDKINFVEKSNFKNYPQHIVQFTYNKKAQTKQVLIDERFAIKQVRLQDCILFSSSTLQKRPHQQILKKFANEWSIGLKFKWISECSKALQELLQLKIKINHISFQLFVFSISDGKFKYLLLQNQQIDNKKLKKQESQKQLHPFQIFCQIVRNYIYCRVQVQNHNDHIKNIKYSLYPNIKNESFSQNESQNSHFISKFQQISATILNEQQNIFQMFKKLTYFTNQTLKELKLKDLSQNRSKGNISRRYNQNSLQISDYGNLSSLQNYEKSTENNIQSEFESNARKEIDSLIENFNFADFGLLNSIIAKLSQFKSSRKQLYQEQKYFSFFIDKSNILKFNQFFKNLEFKEKIRIFLDILDSYQKFSQKITKCQYEFCEISEDEYEKIHIVLNLKKFKYQLDFKKISKNFSKQFSVFLLKALLIIDDQNNSMKIDDSINLRFKQASITSPLSFLESKVKYFLFSKKIKIEQNEKILLALIKFYLIFNSNLQSKTQKQQQKNYLNFNHLEQFSKIRKQIQSVFFEYKEATQCQQERMNQQFKECKTDVNWLKAETKLIQFDNISQFSKQDIQMWNFNFKQQIALKINKTQPKYGKLVTAYSGLVHFQKVYNTINQFDVYEFNKLQNYYLEIQFLILCGHNFGKQGFKILNNIPFKELRIYEVWRNNIQTYWDSNFQKLQKLISFSGTFNPLKIDTIRYMLLHKWPKIKQLRIQFIDGNESWPLMINECIPHSFPNLKRLRVGDSDIRKNQKQILNQATKQLIKSLQAKGIVLL